MKLPRLSPSDIQAAIPDLVDVGAPIKGGQKLVFPCKKGDQTFALKAMSVDSSLGNDPSRIDETFERAAREVELMRQFDSPHLAKMGPIGLERVTIRRQEIAWFTEEWIEGADLKSIIQRDGPMAPEEVVRLGLQMVGAIELLWSTNVVHRDIKPGNIMRRDSTGDYVLLDLGLALDLADISLTRTGQIAGTPAYLSPEQLDPAHKRDLNCRSDFFALGIVLYEALTGKHPFQLPGVTGMAIGQLIQQAEVRPPSSLRNGIPPKLSEAICRMLEKKPQLRYRNCAACRSALAQVKP